jgi:hypothetical protein
LLPENAYFTYPASFDVRLSDRDESVVLQCRDFTEYLTPEFAEKIKYIEYATSESPIETYYKKNDHLYSYFEYRGVENSRELPKNKLIEEMYDKYYADGGYDSGDQSMTKFGVFIRFSTGFERQTYYYSLAERKFITFEDFFKDGFEEHLEIDVDRYNTKKSPYEIYQDSFIPIESDDEYGNYAIDNNRYYALYNIANQLSDKHKDTYIVITGSSTPHLRIDAVWLKDIYQNLP